MQHLDVTDDQLAYLEGVRATLESEYLGPYGRVDLQDALQYLIDVHETAAPEMPRTDASVVAAAGGETDRNGVRPTDDLSDGNPSPEGTGQPTRAAAGGVSTDDPSEAPTGDESSDASTADGEPSHATPADESSDAPAAPVEAAAGESTPSPEAASGESPTGETTTEPANSTEGTRGDGADGKPPATDADEEPVEAETDDADGQSSSEDAGGSSFPAGSGGNDRLQAMMNLLDTHGDKWREGDGEARYEVDLPDGSTETVQTRDDVRAVLFKNYR